MGNIGKATEPRSINNQWQPTQVTDIYLTRSRTRQNFELVHINGPVQNFGPPARNFSPLRAEFAWREWRKMLGGHVANWAALSCFSHQENKISRTFFIDCINKHSKVSNAHNSDDCHGVFNGGMLNKGWSFSRSRFDCLGLMLFSMGNYDLRKILRMSNRRKYYQKTNDQVWSSLRTEKFEQT